MKKYYLWLLLMALPFISRASAYWMEVKGSGQLDQPVIIQICYGFMDDYNVRQRDTGRELELISGFKINITDADGKITELPIRKKSDCWEASFIPQKNGTYQISGIYDSHPVVDRSKTGGINVRPVDYLYAVYAVGKPAAAKPSAQLLDLMTETKGKLVTVKAFYKNLPSPKGTKIRVFNPENWEKELVLDEHGEAVFALTMKGLYIIRQDWTDPKSGVYQGIPYASVRYRCNYCLQVEK